MPANLNSDHRRSKSNNNKAMLYCKTLPNEKRPHGSPEFINLKAWVSSLQQPFQPIANTPSLRTHGKHHQPEIARQKVRSGGGLRWPIDTRARFRQPISWAERASNGSVWTWDWLIESSLGCEFGLAVRISRGDVRGSPNHPTETSRASEIFQVLRA